MVQRTMSSRSLSVEGEEMSICSDVYISLEKARKMVLKKLLYDQTKLIEKAVSAMDEWELTSILNKDSDIYYYNIESKDEEGEE